MRRQGEMPINEQSSRRQNTAIVIALNVYIVLGRREIRNRKRLLEAKNVRKETI